jgi:hypothetical protein
MIINAIDKKIALSMSEDERLEAIINQRLGLNDATRIMMLGYRIKYNNQQCYAVNYLVSKFPDNLLCRYEYCFGYTHDGDIWTIRVESKFNDAGDLARRYGGSGTRMAGTFKVMELPWARKD